MRLVLSALLILLATRTITAAPNANDAPEEQRVERLKEAETKRLGSWHTGLSVGVPEGWCVISEGLNDLMIAERPQDPTDRDKIAWLQMFRSEVGEDAADKLAEHIKQEKARGAQVQHRKLADEFDAFLFARRTSYLHIDAGEESRGTSILTFAYFAHGNDIITLMWQMPEDERFDQHVAAFKALIDTIKVKDRGEGDWPLPENAVKIEKLPYTFEKEMNAGDDLTFVMPNGKTFSIWAQHDKGSAEQRSKSGILASYGYRPHFNGPMTIPGEEESETPFDYIDGPSVSTKMHVRRKRRINVDCYQVTFTENLAAEDRLPIKLAVELAAEAK
ncbi:MAG: hypothetical protein AAGI37_08290 [Planctomycetota bacterium]